MGRKEMERKVQRREPLFLPLHWTAAGEKLRSEIGTENGKRPGSLTQSEWGVHGELKEKNNAECLPFIALPVKTGMELGVYLPPVSLLRRSPEGKMINLSILRIILSWQLWEGMSGKIKLSLQGILELLESLPSESSDSPTGDSSDEVPANNLLEFSSF
ncbi:hypothetical protein TNCV_4196371 [Trichonephila clavipes]|nr:hypothetical protein TNCV_4196371 [Trichonephila clavipes]